MNIRTTRRRFHHPVSIHAPWVGWAWNAPLDDDHLTAQAEALVRGGFGGAAIYPQEGLSRDHHTSPAWFEHIAAVARKLRRKGLSLHLRESLEGPFAAVDESVCREHPNACLTELTVEDVHPGTVDAANLGDALAVFAVTKVGVSPSALPGAPGSLQPTAVRRLEAPWTDAAVRDQRLLVFRVRSIPNRLNYFDREASALFLESVPRLLGVHAKRYLGNPIAGLFIDGVGLRLTPGAVPWDAEIEVLFQETRGYSLLDSLPALFYELDEHTQVRYDYWTIVTDMLREGLVTPIRTWCEERRLRFGISLRPLDRPDAALLETALLPVERSSDDFVIRVPYDTANEGYENPAAFSRWLVAIKRACSLCEQLGGTRRTAVSVGCETAVLDLERAGALGKWLYSLGAHTVIFEQLSYEPAFPGRESRFSLRTEDPYWDALPALNQSLSRIASLLMQGRAWCSAAILDVSASVQALHAQPLHASEVNGGAGSLAATPEQLLLAHTAQLATALHAAGIDFHIVQERTLAEHGAGYRHELAVGEQRYRLLLVPPCVNLRGQTLELLSDFAMGGGVVAFTGSLPYLVDGRPSKYLRKFLQEYGTVLPNRADLFDYTPIVEYLRARPGFAGAEVETQEGSPDHILLHRRLDDNVEIHYTFNPARGPAHVGLRLPSAVEGHVEEWNPKTGAMRGLSACNGQDPIAIDGHWEGYGARIFVTMPAGYRESATSEPKTKSTLASSGWQIARNAPNAAVLRSCTIFETPEPGAVRKLDEARQLLRRDLSSSGRPVRWTTRWQFDVAEAGALPADCRLLVPRGHRPEEAAEESAAAQLNGAALDGSIEERYAGRLWDAYPCGSFVEGVNTVEVQSEFSSEREFVPPVVLGEFAVDRGEAGGVALRPFDVSPGVGDWRALGLPDYEGSVTYRATFTLPDSIKELELALAAPGLAGTATVHVNDTEVGTLLWRPYELDITGACRKGENTVSITVSAKPGGAYAAGDGDAAPSRGILVPPVIRVEGPAGMSVEVSGESDAES